MCHISPKKLLLFFIRHRYSILDFVTIENLKLHLKIVLRGEKMAKMIVAVILVGLIFHVYC